MKTMRFSLLIVALVVAFSASGGAIRDGCDSIFVMRLASAYAINLTPQTVGNFSPAWSADGRQIVFTSFRDGNDEIYVMAADGSHPINLTNHPDGDSFPAWSPK